MTYLALSLLIWSSACSSLFFFFFSSRRRHTRCSRDWSSDVCSSDLVVDPLLRPRRPRLRERVAVPHPRRAAGGRAGRAAGEGRRLIRVYAHAGGATRPAERVERAWLEPGSPVLVWVDLFNPTPDEGRLLSDVFHFHELAGEDALSAPNDPEGESHGDYLYP